MAIVGAAAAIRVMALYPGKNKYTGPGYSAKACLMVAGNITTSVNKGGLAEWSTYLDVSGSAEGTVILPLIR